MWKVQLFKLNFDHRETEAAAAVVDSGWLTMGERVIEFEVAFSRLLKSNRTGEIQSLAVTNCTSALQMAVLAAGVKPGDEVIVPGLTFVADANVVKLAGADPVFADCRSEKDLNVSLEDIAQKVTARTKAVIVVHFGGFACEIDRIAQFCKERSLFLIEDVAHAPGASYKGQALGTFGDVGCFSFFSNKNLSVGEGGLVCCSDPVILAKLRSLRSHGMTALTLDRHKGRAFTYDVVEPGSNFRMDEIHAAIALVQLDKLKDANQARKRLTEHYRIALKRTPVVVPFEDEGDCEPAYHILPVLLPEEIDRIKIMESMKEDGIQSSIHYPPFWSFKAYADSARPEETPNIRAIASRELTLPLYPTMTTVEVDLVVNALARALKDAGKVNE